MRKYIIALCALLPFVVVGQYVTDVFPDDGSKVLIYGANSAGNGTTTVGFNELISTGALGSAPNYVGYWCRVIHDAGGAGTAPQTQMRQVTGYSSTTGVLTFATGFANALASGDKVYLFPGSSLQAICGTEGVPAVTATKLAAGENLADGMLYASNIADSCEAEGELIRSSTDSLQKWIGGADGATWGTATEPAAGINLIEGFGFAQNQLDSISGGFYGAVGLQWGTATEPGNGVNLVEGFGYAQNQLDSLVGGVYGDVGLQWGTAAAPANGVALDEAIRKIYDLVAVTAGVGDLDTLVVYVNHVLADSVWVTVGENEVIAFPTGVEIEFWLSVRDSIALDGADSISVCIGDGTATILTKILKVDLDAGEYVTFAPASLGTYRVENPTLANFSVIGDGMAGTSVFHGVSNGADIGFNVQTATIITTGYSVWTLVYRVKSGSGVPTAGAGGDM